ncbi:hypothetical protein QF047_001802 [Arthrobacter sp. W4I7]|nr:hypothetical protein [Arthrobacter sp. W4I7]
MLMPSPKPLHPPQVTVTSAGSGDPCSMQCVTMIGYVQLSSIGDREVIGNAS